MAHLPKGRIAGHRQHTLCQRSQKLPLDRRVRIEHRVERAVADYKESEWRYGSNRGSSVRARYQRDLTEELTRSHSPNVLPTHSDLGLALDDDEELAST